MKFLRKPEVYLPAGLALAALVLFTAASAKIHSLYLLDADNTPFSGVNLSSTNWTGTLAAARLPASVPLLSGGNLTISGSYYGDGSHLTGLGGTLAGQPINPSSVGATTPGTGAFTSLSTTGLSATNPLSLDGGAITSTGAGVLYAVNYVGSGYGLTGIHAAIIADSLGLAHGGTGGTDAASARAGLGVSYGTTAGTVPQGNDTRFPASVTGLRKGAGAGSADVAAMPGTDYLTPTGSGAGLTNVVPYHPSSPPASVDLSSVSGNISTSSYNATDVSGKIAFTTTGVYSSTVIAAGSTVAVVTFGTAYGSAPRAIVYALDFNTGGSPRTGGDLYAVINDATKFTVYTRGGLSGGTVYTFNYIISQQ